jgi:large subunit ribosomal protein L18
MAKTNAKHTARLRRKKHIRKNVHGTPEKPRLCVFRSARHIYAQLIDDENHCTLASASSLKFDEAGGNRDGAKDVGRLIAEAAMGQNITSVVFDRNGYLYHGRVAALADGAREAGLKF